MALEFWLSRQPDRKSDKEKTGASGSQCERKGNKEKDRDKERFHTQEKEEKKNSGQSRIGFKLRKTSSEPEASPQERKDSLGK